MADRTQGRLGSGFGPKSEPEQVLADIDLSGQVAVVTGGYSGIGLETTRALAACGAQVHVPVRDPEKARANLADIRGDVQMAQMDLADLASVAAFADSLTTRIHKLDLLINNAGIMACPETRVGRDWEAQFATNHLGHFVLTDALLKVLLNAAMPRVICLSSTAHKRSGIRWDDIHFRNEDYEKWTAYGQAKTANALFALSLDMRFSDRGLQAFSVHPGGILTPLQRHLMNEEMAAMGWTDTEGNLTEQAAALFKSPAQGCATTLWAATSPQLVGRGGVYCENCDIADPAGGDVPPFMGVEAWATDAEAAERLWTVTEQMLA
ncbi:MAG: oxidoreductase [Pseudomonadota bacterium]